jgi:hypothetical protein
MIMSEEIELLEPNMKIGLNHNQHELYDLNLRVHIDKLPDDVIWEPFFIYKLIKKITCEYGGNIIFQTNGLFIRSKIELGKQQLKKSFYGYIYDEQELEELSKKEFDFFVPLFFPQDMPLYSACFSSPTITIDFDTRLTNNKKVLAPIKIFLEPVYRNLFAITKFDKKITINDFRKIDIPNNKNIFTYNFNNHLIEYLLFIVDGTSKIQRITIEANSIILGSYDYTELNSVIPYHYLGHTSPEEYMFISFMGNCHEGLNLSKVDFTINFGLGENNGGHIYLLSEVKNILHVESGAACMRFSNHSRQFDDIHSDEISINKISSNKTNYIHYQVEQESDIFHISI